MALGGIRSRRVDELGRVANCRPMTCPKLPAARTYPRPPRQRGPPVLCRQPNCRLRCPQVRVPEGPLHVETTAHQIADQERQLAISSGTGRREPVTVNVRPRVEQAVEHPSRLSEWVTS